MRILGVNISHNPSISLCENGKITKHYDETRFIKNKIFYPGDFLLNSDESQKIFYECINKIDGYVDHVIFSSFAAKLCRVDHKYDTNDLKYKPVIEQKHLDYKIISNFKKQISNKLLNLSNVWYFNEHHLYHALSGFYQSNFDESICIVLDAGGSSYFLDSMPTYLEIESIFYINRKEIKKLYSHLSNANFEHFQFAIPEMQNKSYLEKKYEGCKYVFSSKHSSALRFSALTNFLKLESNPKEFGASSGKTMGLAAYGNPDGDRPEDLAHKLQLETEKDTSDLIDYASKLHDCKNIILSGGYAMNCLNNYKYVKSFPNLNFFVDPCAWDGGTSIGAAIWLHRELNKNLLI